MKQLDKAYFEELFAILEAEFPLSEYRCKEEQEALWDLPYYTVYGAFDDAGELMVFGSFWELPNCNFLEHYAVKQNYQGKGVGKAFLREYLQEHQDKPLVGEVEPPCDETTERRIRFYQGLGLILHDFLYYQQPLRSGDAPQELRIISSKPLTEESFFPYKKEIYEAVYGVVLTAEE